MKESHIMVLDEEEDELANLLEKMGLNKNVSVVVTCLFSKDGLKSKDIQRIANISQPEVSIAIQKLNGRGWVDEKVANKKERGRPTMEYRLSKSIEDIVGELEKEWIEKKKEEKNNIRRIKELINKKR